MAPIPGIDTNRIKDSALKDLLDLLEGVRSYASCLSTALELTGKLGPRQEGPVPRSKLEWIYWAFHKILGSPGVYEQRKLRNSMKLTSAGLRCRQDILAR